MQDMNPRGDRSIRNIPVSTSHRRVQAQEVDIEEETDYQPPRVPKGSNRSRSRTFVWWTVSAVVLFGLAGLVASTIFQGATVTIYPKTEPVTPPSSLLAVANAPTGTLGYQTMSVTQSASTSAAASGSKDVSKPATGVVTVYNAHGTASQQLIANTRFEASDGKIYRIHDQITVPGGVKKSDGTVTPGSTTATLYADVPGAEHNRTDTTRFTIPGFKNDPRHTKFYAESKGPMSGGFVGKEPAIAAATLTEAQNTLKQKLDANIRAAIVSNIPAGFIPVDGSLAVVYNEITQTAGANNNASLVQSATASSVIIRASDLAAAVAKQSLGTYNNEPVAFADSSQITIALSSTNKSTTGPLTLALGGTPILVWQFDPAAVKKALLGKDKDDLKTILKTFQPAIIKATASIRPFWKATFPIDESKLNLKVAE